MKSRLLSVEAVCPTYGRFTRLRDAIACFLLQDYTGEKQLSILNDVHIPLQLTTDSNTITIQEASGSTTSIVLTNVDKRFPTVGQKRQALADSARLDIIAHWDDDDLFLPWHITTFATILQARPEIDCVKSRRAFRVTKRPDRLRVARITNNVYDGQMFYRRGTAIDYPNKVRSVPKDLIRDYRERGKLDKCPTMPISEFSYLYRCSDGMRHLCRIGSNRVRSAVVQKMFYIGNKDFGEGKILLPDDDFLNWARKHIRNQFEQFVSSLALIVRAEIVDSISLRIQKRLEKNE